MVYYVIKLDHGIYWATRGPYGECNCAVTPKGAQRFLRKKDAKTFIHKHGLDGAQVEPFEVTNGC